MEGGSDANHTQENTSYTTEERWEGESGERWEGERWEGERCEKEGGQRERQESP